MYGKDKILSEIECCVAFGLHFKYVFINENNCLPTNNEFNLNIPTMQNNSLCLINAIMYLPIVFSSFANALYFANASYCL